MATAPTTLTTRTDSIAIPIAPDSSETTKAGDLGGRQVVQIPPAPKVLGCFRSYWEPIFALAAAVGTVVIVAGILTDDSLYIAAGCAYTAQGLAAFYVVRKYKDGHDLHNTALALQQQVRERDKQLEEGRTQIQQRDQLNTQQAKLLTTTQEENKKFKTQILKLSEMVKKARAAIDQVQGTADDLQETTDELGDTVDALDDRFDVNLDELEALGTTFEGQIDEMKASAARLRNQNRALKETSIEIKAGTQDLSDGLKALKQFQASDKQTNQRTEAVVTSLEQLLPKFQELLMKKQSEA